MQPVEVYSIALRASQQAATRYKLDPIATARWLTAIAGKESTYGANVINRGSTARGMWQMLICTQRDMEQTLGLPFAPAMYDTPPATRCNIRNRAAIPQRVVQSQDRILSDNGYAAMLAANDFARKWAQYKDVDLTLTAYNQGNIKPESRAKAREYVAAVRKFYNQFDPNEQTPRSAPLATVRRASANFEFA